MRNSITFLNQTYEEVQGLLQTSRNYIKWQAPRDIRARSPKESFKVTHEAMRVAIRLSQITAWMLVQRAVHRGEISHVESISPDYQVLRGTAPLEKASETDPDLPLPLRDLLQESRRLYERILRLDEVSRQQHLSSTKIKKEKKIRVV